MLKPLPTNQLLLTELQQTQETLERIYWQAQQETTQLKQVTQQQQQTITQLQQQITQQAKQITQQAKQIQHFKTENSQLQAENKANQQTLKQCYQDIINLKSNAYQKTIKQYKALKRKLRFKKKSLALSAEEAKLQEVMETIKTSGLFDPDWYLASYLDVAAKDVDPLMHFVRHGAFEGRHPSPHFHTDWYLKQYTDIAQAARESGLNPLLHYIHYGKAEGRLPKPESQ